MPKVTKRTIDLLIARDRPFTVFDSDVKGFGVRVMPSGVKTFVLEYRPGAGGRNVLKKRFVLGRHGAMTADQARQAALTALARVRLGEDPQAEKAERRASASVADLIDQFVAGHVAKLKPKTRESYEGALAKLRAEHGAAKADALTRSQVAALHTALAGAPYAANRLLAAVSSAWAWAEAHGLLPEGHPNPAAKVTRYKESGRERYLTTEELARLGDALVEAETIGLPWSVDETKATAKHAPKPENRRTKFDPFTVAAIRLLILTGARLREILGTRWEQVDLQRGVIFLADSKTGRKPVYLSAAAQSVLIALPRLEGNPHVIAGAKDGAPRADLNKPWAAVTRAAGLNGLRIHDLRHSFASFGAGASLGLPIIGKLLGHSQPQTTARYSHLDADPLRRAVETIGTTIDAAMNRRPADVVPLTKRK